MSLTVNRGSRIGLVLTGWLLLAIAILLVGALTACGGGSAPSQRVSGGGGGGGGVSGSASEFFGIHVNHLNNNPSWPVDVPVASLRMWDDQTGWAQIQTSAGPTASNFNWTNMDFWLGLAQQNGVDVLYDLSRTPSFAQCTAGDTICSLAGSASVACAYGPPTVTDPTEGGPGQCLPPSDLNADGTGTNQFWIDWVTAVAAHSKASTTAHIKYYEIWNEPSIAKSWQGTAAQLVRLTQDARCIIIGTNCSSLSTYSQTGIDPSAMITTPAYVGLTTSDPASDASFFMSQFLTQCLGGSPCGGQLVDIIAFHGYVGTDPPENFVPEFNNLTGVLSGILGGPNKLPVFNTEGSWNSVNPVTDPDQQAAWLSRYVLLQYSAGVQKFYWYSWDGGTVGLWTAASGTSKAGHTYGIMNMWLGKGTTSGVATSTGPCSAQGSIYTCNYTRSGGYQALAVWDASQTCNAGNCTTSTFDVPSKYVQYIDTTGTTTSLNGATTVNISLRPILLETGNIP